MDIYLAKIIVIPSNAMKSEHQESNEEIKGVQSQDLKDQTRITLI